MNTAIIIVAAFVLLAAWTLRNSLADNGAKRTQQQARLGRAVQLAGLVALIVLGLLWFNRSSNLTTENRQTPAMERAAEEFAAKETHETEGPTAMERAANRLQKSSAAEPADKSSGSAMQRAAERLVGENQ